MFIYIMLALIYFRYNTVTSDLCMRVFNRYNSSALSRLDGSSAANLHLRSLERLAMVTRGVSEFNVYCAGIPSRALIIEETEKAHLLIPLSLSSCPLSLFLLPLFSFLISPPSFTSRVSLSPPLKQFQILLAQGRYVMSTAH